jgi:hypothetical protein
MRVNFSVARLHGRPARCILKLALQNRAEIDRAGQIHCAQQDADQHGRDQRKLDKRRALAVCAETECERAQSG